MPDSFLDDVFQDASTGNESADTVKETKTNEYGVEKPTMPHPENPADPLEAALGPVDPKMAPAPAVEPQKKTIPRRKKVVKRNAGASLQKKEPESSQSNSVPSASEATSSTPALLFKSKSELGVVKGVTIIFGPEGSGKTTLGLQADDPFYIIETEGGHNLVTAQKQKDDYYAAIIEDNSDITPSQKWFSTSFGLWKQYEDMVNELMRVPSGTVMIDSGSELLGYQVADRAVDWDRGDKAFPTMMYGQVYGVLGQNIAKLRSRHDVIITARVKDEFKNDARTGKEKIDLWRPGIFLAETVVRIKMREDNTRLYLIEKGDLLGTITANLTWEKLMNGSQEDFKEETQSYLEGELKEHLLSQIQAAYTHLKKKNKELVKLKKPKLEFDELSDETLSGTSTADLEKHLNELRVIYQSS
jgi:hypothetical protein